MGEGGIIFVFLLTLLTVWTVSTQVESQTQAGQWTKADVNSENVKEIASFAIQQLEKQGKALRLLKVVTAETQVGTI